MAGLFFAPEAQGERAYLPAVGPPPLYFMAATTNYFVFDPKALVLAAKSKNTNSSVASPATIPATNATNTIEASSPAPATATDAQRSAAMAIPSMVDENKNPAQRYNSDFSSPAASDLLTVTPQMINEYLKPGRSRSGSGNQFDQPGVVVFVPAEMQFQPPAPKTGTESRATYRSQ